MPRVSTRPGSSRRSPRGSAATRVASGDAHWALSLAALICIPESMLLRRGLPDRSGAHPFGCRGPSPPGSAEPLLFRLPAHCHFARWAMHHSPIHRVATPVCHPHYWFFCHIQRLEIVVRLFLQLTLASSRLWQCLASREARPKPHYWFFVIQRLRNRLDLCCWL